MYQNPLTAFLHYQTRKLYKKTKILSQYGHLICQLIQEVKLNLLFYFSDLKYPQDVRSNFLY
jgi:hypothetical protein